MLLPILSEIADKVGIICHSELAIKDINRGWLLPIGNGQAKSVTELDWKAGFSFFALNGNERLTELDSGRARSILLQSVRPLSLFVVIRPEDVGADDSFSAERITQSLKTKIGANNLPISRVRLNAGMVKSSVISVQYGTAVWNELGINGEARLNLIAARFDFEVTIAGNQECFSNWVCEDGVIPAPPPPPAPPIFESRTDYVYPYQYSGTSTTTTDENALGWVINRVDYTNFISPITLSANGAWSNRFNLIYT
jgi:hypothetical protein